MLERYRLYCAALGGILVALATGLHAQDHREQQPQATPAQQAQERPQPPLPITITAPVRVEREKEIEPDWNSLKCSEAKSHDEADLCEQRRMAKSAEDAVLLNKIQIAVARVRITFASARLPLTEPLTHDEVEFDAAASIGPGIDIDAPALLGLAQDGKTRLLLAQEDIDTLKAGQLGFFVLGVVTYKDIFGKDQITNINFQTVPQECRLGRFVMMPAPEGNDAT